MAGRRAITQASWQTGRQAGRQAGSGQGGKVLRAPQPTRSVCLGDPQVWAGAGQQATIGRSAAVHAIAGLYGGAKGISRRSAPGGEHQEARQGLALAPTLGAPASAAACHNTARARSLPALLCGGAPVFARCACMALLRPGWFGGVHPTRLGPCCPFSPVDFPPSPIRAPTPQPAATERTTPINRAPPALWPGPGRHGPRPALGCQCAPGVARDGGRLPRGARPVARGGHATHAAPPLSISEPKPLATFLTRRGPPANMQAPRHSDPRIAISHNRVPSARGAPRSAAAYRRCRAAEGRGAALALRAEQAEAARRPALFV
jgi:hypothetical protein